MANDFKTDYGEINYPNNYDPRDNAVSDSTLATDISAGTDQTATSGIDYNGADAAHFSDYAASIDATDKQQVSDAMGSLEYNPSWSEMAKQFMREAFSKIDSFEAERVQILNKTSDVITNAITNVMYVGR